MHIPTPSHRADRLILHIGAPKTGSTAIQIALTQNRNRLLQQGFLYPTSLGLIAHPLLAICAGSIWRYSNLHREQHVKPVTGVVQARSDVFAMLAAEIDANRPNTLIVSYEGLFSNYSDNASVKRLKKIADAIAKKTQVIVFLRRQDEALLSHFVHGRRLGDSRELRIPHELRQLSYLDYHKQLRHWAAVFGAENLTATPFRRDRFRQGDVVSHFMQSVGIDATGFELSSDSNVGLDCLQEQFLERLNLILPRFKNGQPNPFRWGIHQAIDRAKLTEKRRTLSAEERDYVMDFYQNSNALLARDYGNPSEAFFPPAKATPVQDIPCLSIEDTVQISADLWQWSVEYILTQNERLAQQEAKIQVLENAKP
jgi:hypothetical protein